MSVAFVLDDFDLAEFCSVAEQFGSERFGYVVTPNVDHLIRFHDEPGFRQSYADASFVLLDSRVLAAAFRIRKGVRTKVCTGSDLTERLLSDVITDADRIVLIGGTPEQVHVLTHKFGIRDLRQFVPPMGFIRDPEAVRECVEFIEAQSPFRFCFLAVGSPQQEILAQQIKARGRVRGLALCIGASINFLTGEERRAPVWIRSVGMEWAWRLSMNPQRFAARYLLRGPRVFRLLHKTTVLLRRAGVG